MPLLSIVRFIGTLISLVILCLAIYLLWSWYQGYVARNDNGDLILVQERWRLWTGVALVAWSFVGGPILPLLLARPDRGDPSVPQRANGTILDNTDRPPIYVEKHGAIGGPVIVFTHGWSLDSTIWQYAKRDLAKSFRLVLWDLPGMGRSQPARGHDISLDGFAEQLAHIISAVGEGSKVVLVGHSIGGMTIQTLARDRPQFVADHVAGVVLLNTTYTNPLRTMILPRFMQAIRAPILEPMMRLTILLQPLVWLSAWQSYLSGWTHVSNRLAFGKYVTRSQLRHVSLLSTRNPPGNVARGNLAMFRWDASGALRDIAVPTLVIAGRADIITKPEASQVIAANHAGAELLEVEGANHMGFLERADEYDEAISRFVGKLQMQEPASVSPRAKPRAAS